MLIHVEKCANFCRDILTDACATQHSFTFKNVTGHCHKGILETAKKIFRELNENNLLDAIMSNYPGYGLIICGHSLGAGAAVLLTMMLRDSDKYPDTTCYAFSCPKTMTENLAIMCESFCMAITVGNDIVARLDLSAIEQLKENIVHNLSECDTPKYKIFYDVISGNLQYKNSRRVENNEVIIPINPGYRTLFISDPLPNVDDFFVPGNILHLNYKRNSKNDDEVRGQFRDRHYFKSIRVHPTMFRDHMPAVLLDCLLRCNIIE
ncbi:hypothetical protein GJ496_006301 [Pomphorhynchus laevis]|nr:hypothetical protein GJ496_006301 [Pomphorhynchus laevis]